MSAQDILIVPERNLSPSAFTPIPLQSLATTICILSVDLPVLPILYILSGHIIMWPLWTHNLVTQLCVCDIYLYMSMCVWYISRYLDIYEARCMNWYMGGVRQAWPGRGAMGSWSVCLLIKLLVEGTICILAFYYVGYRIYTEWPDYYEFRDHNN